MRHGTRQFWHLVETSYLAKSSTFRTAEFIIQALYPAWKTCDSNEHQYTEEILSRFSDLFRALRVLSYIFRFYHSGNKTFKLSRKYLSMGLSQDEISFMRHRLIILCQSSHFPEYSILKERITLPRKSSLLIFNLLVNSKVVLSTQHTCVHCTICNSTLSCHFILNFFFIFSSFWFLVLL